MDGKGGEKEGRFEWKWKVRSARPLGRRLTLRLWEIKVTGEFPWVEAH